MANNAILNNIYNYYHAAYYPRTSSKYDAHKKDDLKNVYNSIRTIDKEAPVFLLDTSADVERYTIRMKESALKFREDIAALGGLDEQSMFEQKAVYSSNEALAEAKYITPGKDENKEDKALLTIQKLATGQTNHGIYLSSENRGIAEGSYSFDVETNISSYELQFAINENDTNLSIQTRLARLINGANIGLNASVSYGDNQRSALVISSVSTGAYDGEQPFSISDENTSQGKGIVDYLGIRNISQPAGWAEYTVDGKSYLSSGNDVVLHDTFAVRLKQASGETITIETKPDVDSLKENIHGLAGAYNNFLRAASEYLDKYPRTTLLVGSMKRMTGNYQNEMSLLGMKQDADGNLQVDDEILTKNLQDNSMEKAVDGLRAFTRKTLEKAGQVQLNPMDYVDKRIVAYKNPYKSHFPNPYITSAYSGMLFNGYM